MSLQNTSFFERTAKLFRPLLECIHPSNSCSGGVFQLQHKLLRHKHSLGLARRNYFLFTLLRSLVNSSLSLTKPRTKILKEKVWMKSKDIYTILRIKCLAHSIKCVENFLYIIKKHVFHLVSHRLSVLLYLHILTNT